jgi:hypothetical protein
MIVMKIKILMLLKKIIYSLCEILKKITKIKVLLLSIYYNNILIIKIKIKISMR